MIYAYLIGIPAALLAAFFGLAAYEARAGHRVVLAGRRYALDLKAARVAFVLKHVDWGAFANDVIRAGLERALHDVAHGALIATRAIERELTAIVRALRARREHPAIGTPREDRPSRIQSAVSYLKRSVRRSRKQLPPGEDAR